MSDTLASRVGHHAIGALAAQKVIYRIKQFEDPSIAFDELLTLVDAHGVNSVAVAAYLRELAKR